MGTRQWVSSGSPFEEPVGYSRATRAGDRILVSGTAPVWPDGSCAADATLQARRCFEIIEAALSQLGSKLSDIVQDARLHHGRGRCRRRRLGAR